MPTLRDLRLEAALSIAELARLANVDRKTVERAEGGQPLQDAKAAAIVNALSHHLGRRIALGDVQNLTIL